MTIKMRSDLAEEGYTIPAGLSFSDYDDLHADFYLSAEDLADAVEYDNGVDPDSHPFCVVKLKDGRVVYMIGADLDWFN
jgi:hypothetical protein